jgi:hypothetical protein
VRKSSHVLTDNDGCKCLVARTRGSTVRNESDSAALKRYDLSDSMRYRFPVTRRALGNKGDDVAFLESEDVDLLDDYNVSGIKVCRLHRV